MSAAEIWEQGLDEGERRLTRGWTGLAATGFAGGIDVFFSLLLLAVASAGLHAAMSEPAAHVIASLAFGVGFVFITLGRAELFTRELPRTGRSSLGPAGERRRAQPDVGRDACLELRGPAALRRPVLDRGRRRA